MFRLTEYLIKPDTNIEEAFPRFEDKLDLITTLICAVTPKDEEKTSYFDHVARVIHACNNKQFLGANSVLEYCSTFAKRVTEKRQRQLCQDLEIFSEYGKSRAALQNDSGEPIEPLSTFPAYRKKAPLYYALREAWQVVECGVKNAWIPSLWSTNVAADKVDYEKHLKLCLSAAAENNLAECVARLCDFLTKKPSIGNGSYAYCLMDSLAVQMGEEYKKLLDKRRLNKSVPEIVGLFCKEMVAHFLPSISPGPKIRRQPEPPQLGDTDPRPVATVLQFK